MIDFHNPTTTKTEATITTAEANKVNVANARFLQSNYTTTSRNRKLISKVRKITSKENTQSLSKLSTAFK